MTDIRYPSRALNSAIDSVSIVTGGTSLDVNLHDGAGTAITSQVNGAQQALDVGVNVAGVQVDPRAIRALTATDVITANQGGTWDINNISGTVSLPTGAATSAKQPALGTSGTPSADVLTVQGAVGMTALKVDGSGSTQPVSGTVTANQGGTWDINNVSGTVSLPTGAATSAKQPALGTAGTASADVITVQGIASMTALKVDGSAVTQPVSQSGTWNINNVSGTVSLPTGAATSAKQPALGTAGTPSADVITVQGTASMTALKVDGSAVTQPVSIASIPAESGRSSVLLYRKDYSAGSVTTSAYTEVTASTSGSISRIYIADTSGSAMILATGAAGAEVDRLYIGPGGNDAPYELAIAASTRIAIKALDVNATSGQIIITALS